QPAILQASAEELVLRGCGVRGSEVDPFLVLVQSLDRDHLPVAPGDLAHEPTASIVEVDVVEAVPLAQPEKLLPGVDPAEVVVHIQPGRRRLAQDHPALSRGYVR